jgi:hypothetical protein
MGWDSPIAFYLTELEPPGLEVRVNFGIAAGRAATPAELDDLAARLVAEVGDVAVVAEERHEVGPEAEAAVHQVRVELAPDHVPERRDELEQLGEHLVEIAETWTRDCFAERHADVSEF